MGLDLFELSASLNLDTSGFSSGITGAMSMITGLADFAQKKFDWLAGAAFDFGKDVFETGLGFDAAMANTQSVLGSVEGNLETMNKLRKYAIDQARDSVFTTEDAANAYYYMGQMGWDAEQMMAGLPAVLDLAAASGLGLEQTSRIVSSSLSAFGKEAEDAEWYVDILAQTSRNSGTDVSEMAQALKYAAPYAGALGVGVDDTAVALGLMGDNAIRSGMAGRTLRNVFSRLANDTNDALTTLQGLGVEVFDDTGKFRDFGDIIMDSREAWAGMTDQQKISNATIVAGTQGSSGWLSIMNATDDKVKDLTESIRSATGAAQEMADTRIGTNLAGDFTKFMSAMNAMETVIYDDINGPLREVVQWGTDAINEITDAIGEKGLEGGIDALSDKIEELGESEALQNLLQKVGGIVGTVLRGALDEVIPAIADKAPEVISAFMGGLSESTERSGGAVTKIVGLIAGGLSDVFNPEKTLTVDGVQITLNPDSIQEAIDRAQEAGEATVTINGVTFPSDFNAVDVMDVFINATDTCITDGFASAVVNGEDIFNTGAKDAAKAYTDEFANIGAEIGQTIADDISSKLSRQSYSIDINAKVKNLPDNVSIHHNASAMPAGRIFNRPTIFGYAEGAYQVAGDAGPEAVVGVNSLHSMITSAVNAAMGGQEVIVPRDSGRDITIILEVDRQQFARTVYKANREETQRVGVRMATGGAY